MLGYICKYAPIEVFEAMGVEMKRIEPDVASFGQADMRMHPNICSFAKGVLEDVIQGDYEGVILTTCCDSIRPAVRCAEGGISGPVYLYAGYTPDYQRRGNCSL